MECVEKTVDAATRDQLLKRIGRRLREIDDRGTLAANLLERLVRAAREVHDPTARSELSMTLAQIKSRHGASAEARDLMQLSRQAIDAIDEAFVRKLRMREWQYAAQSMPSVDLGVPRAARFPHMIGLEELLDEVPMRWKQNQPEAARELLGKAEQLIHATSNVTPHNELQSAWTSLMWTALNVGDHSRAANALPRSSVHDTDRVEVLLRCGRVTESREAAEAAISEDLHKRTDNCGNWHHAMNSLKAIADRQWKHADQGGFEKSVAQIIEAVRGWDLVSDWIIAAVYAQAGSLLMRTGAGERAAEAFSVASEAAGNETGDLSDTAWRCIYDAYEELGQYDDALEAAVKMRSLKERRELKIGMLGAANRLEEAWDLLNQVTSPDEQSNLAVKVASALARKRDQSRDSVS
jgi:tetratricopeptide (TPR) repeat protein